MAAPPQSVQPQYQPAQYAPRDRQVDQLQASINIGVTHRAELEDRVKKESELHDKLHAQMVKSERDTLSAVTKAQSLAIRKKAPLKITFRPGKETGVASAPKLKIKGHATDGQLDKAVEDVKLEFAEYRDHWSSHKGSDKRLQKAVDNLQAHEKRMDTTAKSLQRAQQALARSTEAQAKMSEKQSKAKTPGYFEQQRQIARQKAETKREKAETDRLLREEKEKSRLQQIETKERKQKEKEAREDAARQKAQEKQMKRDEELKERRMKEGIASFRRPSLPEVHVRKHQRRQR